ncbi:MAG TPA: phosphatase PAP2 family protein [Thermoanaerobaculaceae bacterium]|nr:phosphatase PAP2 family protein [Thermoanaerobaculaceae bacterium]
MPAVYAAPRIAPGREYPRWVYGWLIGDTVRRRVVLAALLLVATRASAGDLLPSVAAQARRDATALVTIDNPPTPAETAVGIALLAALSAGDRHLSAEGQQHLPGWLDHFTSGGNTGTPNLFAGALVAEGLVFRDRRGIVGGLTLVEGNILLDLALKATKSAFGRSRPNRPDAGDWRTGGDSFPSSHAAHAFMIAAVLDATVDRPAWRWVLYPLASGVALARVHEGVHFPTDVAAGGLLGWWIGHRLSVAHDLTGVKKKVDVSIVPTRGGALVVARISR